MMIQPSPGHLFPDQLLGVNELVEGDRINYYPRRDDDGNIFEMEVELPGFDRTIERHEAIEVINRVRVQYAKCDSLPRIHHDLSRFKPKVLVVYPYCRGWEQGFIIWATIKRDTRYIYYPLPSEITNNKVPNRRAYIVAAKNWK